MPEPVSLRIAGAVAVITIDNPPVNALAAAVRAGLRDALARAGADQSIRVIVLAAAGRTWPAGADIREFGQPPADPDLPTLCTTLAGSAKPVIAALHGTALGGGLELALAAGCRIAAPGTRLGLPEVSLGILPGAGGTQRLPRLIGAKAALGLMLSGLPIAAERGQEMGLVDLVTPDTDVTGAAEALAHAVADGTAVLPGGARPNRALADPAAFLAAVEEARAGLPPPHQRLPAPGRIIDCVEAAILLPEAEGHVYERAAFEDLLATPQSAGLRHAFFAERRAARPRELAGVPPRPVERIGIVGSGTTGTTLATALIGAGHRVTIIDGDDAALSVGLNRVAERLTQAVTAGTLTAGDSDRDWARLEGGTDLTLLSACDLVVIAAGAGQQEKATILAGLDPVLRASTVLAVAVDALGHGGGAAVALDAAADAAGRPDDVMALHLLAPAERGKLIEVATATRTAPAALATLLGVLGRIGRRVVRQRAAGGLISHRMIGALAMAMDRMVEAGATPYEVDRALTGFGFAQGLYRLTDRLGLDAPCWPEASAFRQRLRAAGRHGMAAGRGVYRYEEDERQGNEDTDILALLSGLRSELGIVAERPLQRDIRRRAVAALANEGARLLDEGTAFGPGDIDVVMMTGFGYPRWRGGPMQTADQAGLLQVLNDLRDLARDGDPFWQPSPIWQDLIKNGRAFADLDRD
ncbi:MAG: enoyl-CoA hydratase/isomerase family protein [Rhodobacteraceae bacterium]|nr:enoyl-CoA hydratase/isomerase family protein [Paracoccaceae bacterium]